MPTNASDRKERSVRSRPWDGLDSVTPLTKEHLTKDGQVGIQGYPLPNFQQNPKALTFNVEYPNFQF